jgi:hypothetical protein
LTSSAAVKIASYARYALIGPPILGTPGDHLWRSPLAITSGDHLWRSPLAITSGDHLWRSPLAITSGDHPLAITLWRSFGQCLAGCRPRKQIDVEIDVLI